MQWLSTFNAHLLNAVQEAPIASPLLRSALLYAVESPGKRLRPRFVHESGNRAGLAPGAILTLATAIECVHLFSLIHDDLPALDNDDWRRGLPTVHKKFDEGTALLAGDELLNFSYRLIAGLAPFAPNPGAFGIMLDCFSRSIGGEGMIGGQMLELELVQGTRAADLDTLIRIQELKTGALFRASILTPALLAGEPPESKKIEELDRYAAAFGFAFQIADDLEDEEQDRNQAKKNILSLLGKEQAVRLAAEGLRMSPGSDAFSATGFLLSRLKT
jgi:geranylgeranyl pyrophosphate synthase